MAVTRWSRVASDSGIWLSCSGQSLLEVALLTPMLLALLLGAIETGRYAYISILVGNAARAGAAYGAQSLAQSVDTAGIQTAAANDFQNNGQNTGDLAISSTTSCGCDSTGTITGAPCRNSLAGSCAPGNPVMIPGSSHWVVMVSVTASGTFHSLFNYPGIPNTLTLSNTATLRVAQI